MLAHAGALKLDKNQNEPHMEPIVQAALGAEPTNAGIHPKLTIFDTGGSTRGVSAAVG
jgi:hypothetical protein